MTSLTHQLQALVWAQVLLNTLHSPYSIHSSLQLHLVGRLCKVYPGCTEKEPKARVPRLVIKPQRSVQTGLSL